MWINGSFVWADGQSYETNAQAAESGFFYSTAEAEAHLESTGWTRTPAGAYTIEKADTKFAAYPDLVPRYRAMVVGSRDGTRYKIETSLDGLLNVTP